MSMFLEPVDPDIDALWGLQTEFHANQRAIVERLAQTNALRPGLGCRSGH